MLLQEVNSDLPEVNSDERSSSILPEVNFLLFNII